MFRRRETRDGAAETSPDRDSTPDRGDTEVIEREESVRAGVVWSPAQIVAFVIGGAAIVFGTIALIRTGVNVDEWYGPERSVADFVHTPLLAVTEIGFGIVMVLSALSPSGRPLMALLSAVALAFGILVVADAWESRLQDWFGATDRNGWLFVVVGGVGLVAALLMPTVHGRDRARVTERRRVGQPHTAH